MDHLSKERRSWNMSRIKSKNTKPELMVRSALHRMGYRFLLNGKVSKRIYKKGILPGKPDIVLAKYRTVVFVHGCFWHRHEGCNRCTMPSTNREYWMKKFNRNIKRDIEVTQELNNCGWRVIIIWECEVKNNKIDLSAELI